MEGHLLSFSSTSPTASTWMPPSSAALENPRHRQGLQGACGAGRLRPLGHRGDPACRLQIAKTREPAALHPTSASCGRLPAESGANGVDPDTILEQVVPLLKPGDIIAHPFTRHPGGFVNRQGKVHPIVKEALAMGLKTDVGHGSHFSYKMARIALDAGIVPGHAGRRHARLQHARAETFEGARRHARRASRQGAHVLRPDALLARLGDERPCWRWA